MANFSPFVPPNLINQLTSTERRLGIAPSTGLQLPQIQVPTLAETIAGQNTTPRGLPPVTFPQDQQAKGGFFQFLGSPAGQALLTGLEGTLGALAQPEQTTIQGLPQSPIPNIQVRDPGTAILAQLLSGGGRF